MENFVGTKSWRKILDGLKQKVDIFTGTKNISNKKKTYDSFDLAYLGFIRRRVKFPYKWRCWISKFLSTTTIFDIVNGSSTNEFFMGHGLRQMILCLIFYFSLQRKIFTLFFLDDQTSEVWWVSSRWRWIFQSHSSLIC